MKKLTFVIFICITEGIQASLLKDYDKIVNQTDKCCKKIYKDIPLKDCEIILKNAISRTQIQDLLFMELGKNTVEDIMKVLINELEFVCKKVVVIKKKHALPADVFGFWVASGIVPPNDRTLVDKYISTMLSSYPGEEIRSAMNVGADWWQFLLHKEPTFLEILTNNDKKEFKQYLTNTDFKTFYFSYREVTDKKKAEKCYITKVMSVWKANEKVITGMSADELKETFIPQLFHNC